jgi:UPF0042 nucleotide-binding protein
VALHALEDAGYFCVDNLPPELLRDFIRLSTNASRTAWPWRWTCAPRGRCRLVPLIDELRSEGVRVRPLFLDASTDALVRRFSETRRPHPLVGPTGGGGRAHALIDAIELERELLADLREVSTVIDTSQLRPAGCAAGCGRLVGATRGGLTLVFESFAFKHGVPLDADYVFDVRVLPNPYYIRELRPLTGRDAPVAPTWSAARGGRDAAARSRPSCALAAGLRDQRSYLSPWPSAAPAASTARSTPSRMAGARFADQACATHAGAPPRAGRRRLRSAPCTLGCRPCRPLPLFPLHGAVPGRAAAAEGVRGALPRPGQHCLRSAARSAWCACARAPRPAATATTVHWRRGRAGPSGRGRRRAGRHPARALHRRPALRILGATHAAATTACGSGRQAGRGPDPMLRLPGPAMLSAVKAWPNAIESAGARAATPSCRRTGWTMPAGWPTAGASCCPSRWPPSRS